MLCEGRLCARQPHHARNHVPAARAARQVRAMVPRAAPSGMARPLRPGLRLQLHARGRIRLSHLLPLLSLLVSWRL